jgi:hypothetical protein
METATAHYNELRHEPVAVHRPLVVKHCHGTMPLHSAFTPQYLPYSYKNTT